MGFFDSILHELGVDEALAEIQGLGDDLVKELTETGKELLATTQQTSDDITSSVASVTSSVTSVTDTAQEAVQGAKNKINIRLK